MTNTNTSFGTVVMVMITVSLLSLALMGKAVTATPPTIMPNKEAQVHVQISLGTIVGNKLSTAQEYLGIPYAVPPVGGLRFLPTQDWTTPYRGGSFEATSYGNYCPQNPGPGGPPPGNMSEDCLILNIYTPSSSPSSSEPNRKLPVMVYFHGGGFTSGSANMFNSTSMVTNHDVIVVLVNYRLGALGLLAMPDLASDKKSTGNQLYLDQQSALRWIRRYINAFGGDPFRTSIWGESAGAKSLCVHMTMPSSFGLFTGSIFESPPHCNSAHTLSDALTMTSDAAASVNCTGTGVQLRQCMSALSVSTLLSIKLGMGAPVIDNIVLDGIPLDLIAKGDFAKVPALLGSNTNEGSFFVYLIQHMDTPLNKTAYETALKGMLKNPLLFPDLLSLYPANDQDNRPQLSAAIGDQLIVCTARELAKYITLNRQAAYLYQFAQRDSCSHFPSSWGVPHTMELSFVFDGWNYQVCSPSDQERQLSRDIQSMWTSFATDPTQSPGFDWPVYVAPSSSFSLNGMVDANIILQDSKSSSYQTQQSWRKPFCDFWALDN